MEIGHGTSRPREATVRLANADVALDVGRDTGWIHSLVFQEAGIDLFGQLRGGIEGYVGALRIYDEHDDRWYDDLRTAFGVSDVVVESNRFRCTRRYAGAPFVVGVELRLDDDAFHWEVTAEKVAPEVPDRSLRVYFRFPLIAGWDVWAPCARGEVTFDGMTPFEFMYGQVPYVSDQEIILPMVSHYHRELNVGYSMIEPIDANVPAAKFCFNNAEKCFNWGSMRKDPRAVPVLEAVNYYIGLVGDRPLRTKVMLFAHTGDFRPGLGKVYRRWREYFDPHNRAIYDREGGFLCGGVDHADEIDDLRAMGLKTLEVHGHFSQYCDYFNAGQDRWLRIGARERVYHELARRRTGTADAEPWQAPPSVHAAEVEQFLAENTDEQIAEFIGESDPRRLYHTRGDVTHRLTRLADAGIACHWYFNYTDGYRPRVEADWPDSISRDEDGEPIPSGWYLCHNMNADPQWSFGRFCLESARRILDTYPMLSGFFLDCFRHYEIDFAHDDGVTVVNGRACYSMNRSYDDIQRRLADELLAPRNLTCFANKPMSIRSMRYVDGQLLEGCGDIYEEKFFWASIACPLFFMFTRPTEGVDFYLRRSVLHGAYPTLVDRTDENIALYQRYMPLYAQFRRRVLCFEPDPMRAPANSRGKLYTVGDDYVAGIACDSIADADEITYGKTPYALFRVKRGCDVTRVGAMLPGDDEMRDVPFRFDGTFLAVPLADYKNCAVVRLFVTADTGRQIGPDTFASRPRMCGDPESAFEDVSQR